MGIFDTHAHYMKSDFGSELDELISSMPEKGVDNIIAVGVDTQTSHEELDLAKRYPFVYAAVGIHPENAGLVIDGQLDELERLLSDEKAVALGEIGLDYHYEDGAPKDVQKDVFRRQLEIACRVGKPVIIHSRDAMGDTLEILREFKPKGVIHCFSGSAESALEAVKLGMYIGFTGVLTFKNSKKARAACEVIPTERLLLETDCPYMAPEPLRGQRSDSSMIKYTAAAMAEIKGVSTEKIIEFTSENAKRLFGV